MTKHSISVISVLYGLLTPKQKGAEKPKLVKVPPGQE